MIVDLERYLQVLVYNLLCYLTSVGSSRDVPTQLLRSVIGAPDLVVLVHLNVSAIGNIYRRVLMANSSRLGDDVQLFLLVESSLQ